MPASFTAELDPRIMSPVVTVVVSHARSVSACIDMVTVGAQLVIAALARGHWSVVTSLARGEKWKTHVGRKGNSQGVSGQHMSGQGSVPTKVATTLPFPIDVTIWGVRQAWWLEPRADMPHVGRETLVEVGANVLWLVAWLNMRNQGAEIDLSMVIKVLEGFGEGLVNEVVRLIRGPLSNYGQDCLKLVEGSLMLRMEEA